MTPEERKRFKEEEKAHLRKVKRLKRLARSARSSAGAAQALQDMVGTLDNLGISPDEMVDRLDRESALNEARFEIALENVPATSTESSGRAPAPGARTTPSAESGVPAPAKKAKTIGPDLQSQAPK